MNPTAKRLIDANELRSKAYSAMLEIANTPLPNEYSSKLALKMGEMFQKLIDDAPTVEAEPVRRGWWEDTHEYDPFTGIYKCSECGFFTTMTTGSIVDGKKDNYRPNCGAKMRGDEDATD